MPIHNRRILIHRRKKLRNDCTPEEAILWQHLKHSKVGKKIRRQHSIGNYIVDFYCATERIAIELDGAHHATEAVKQYDEKRTAYLNDLNIKVIRFENWRVHENINEVVNEIRMAVNGSHH